MRLATRILTALTLGGFLAVSSVASASAAGPGPAKPASHVKYCTGIEHDQRVTNSKVIEVLHLHKSGKKSVRDDGLLWLCEKRGSRYVNVSGSGWHANLGYNGTAVKKREGDGKTPKGVFKMKAGFGTKGRPKQFSHGKYTKVTRNYVWVDGKARKNYNTMQKRSDGYSGEPLYQNPAYHYAQVIGYNPKNIPGKGSGIFLHVHTGSGVTAGCVSISEARMKTVFAWEGSSPTQIKIH